MKTLTNTEFRNQIANWQFAIKSAGITLPSGKPVPDKFFHFFLGVGYSTFKKMLCGESSVRKIQLYTSRTIYFLNLLDEPLFLDEVRKCIPSYFESETKKTAS